MSKAPPIPPEQRTFGEKPKGEDPTARLESAHPDRRDGKTELQSAQPGDDDVNLEQQGRQGNIHQNTHHQGYQQDR
jgi:hypothetical protein